ncbi:hypothetical protein GCM10011339_43720 [Echinicola rosea]|uniref:Uncharacterized protein n=1 Tax=Echinicola rosea TaxID=1807691 RepID=A0ABQ1VBP1_9BACT|nr:hypothetical protein GCM10011339_43720 [Echinicola rosea]
MAIQVTKRGEINHRFGYKSAIQVRLKYLKNNINVKYILKNVFFTDFVWFSSRGKATCHIRF